MAVSTLLMLVDHMYHDGICMGRNQYLSQDIALAFASSHNLKGRKWQGILPAACTTAAKLWEECVSLDLSFFRHKNVVVG